MSHCADERDSGLSEGYCLCDEKATADPSTTVAAATFAQDDTRFFDTAASESTPTTT
jgi:hypothetical protein